ncbi:Uncharacterised protein [Vibrio cholerae]|nr:Uncharacterised protein [Vibrio cholerae]
MVASIPVLKAPQNNRPPTKPISRTTPTAALLGLDRRSQNAFRNFINGLFSVNEVNQHVRNRSQPAVLHPPEGRDTANRSSGVERRPTVPHLRGSQSE